MNNEAIAVKGSWSTNNPAMSIFKLHTHTFQLLPSVGSKWAYVSRHT